MMTPRLLPPPHTDDDMPAPGIAPPVGVRPSVDYVPAYQEQPATWQYDFDPATGLSRASYAGTPSSTSLAVSNPATQAPGVSITPVGMYDPSVPQGTGPYWRSNLASNINVGSSGGHYSDLVTYSLLGYVSIYGAPNNNYVGVGGVVDFNGTGGTGQHCGLIGYAHRNVAVAQPTTAVATTLSAPGYTLAVTDVTNLQVPYPMPILINGNGYLQVGVSGTSGPGTITTASGYPAISVADGTAGNTITGNNNPQMWGANIYYTDLTDTDSRHTNNAMGLELDFACDGPDNAGVPLYGVPQGIRTALGIFGVQHTTTGGAAEIGDGVLIGATGNISFKRIFRVVAPYEQSALDLRQATEGGSARAIWLATGQRIALDTAGAVVLTSADGTTFQFSNACQIGGLGVLYTGPPSGAQQVYAAFGYNGSQMLAWENNNLLGALVALPNGGPTIRAGAGAASGTQPSGSLWLRTDGATGTRLYVSAGAGTWNAVAGV